MTEIWIGELAADRAVQTLRYYEELALLTPDRSTDGNGLGRDALARDQTKPFRRG